MPSGQDSEGYTWLAIDDFTAGIWSQPFGVGPAPPGAAQASGTFGCYATPAGALAPLPGVVAHIGAPSFTNLISTSPWNVGTFVNFLVGGDEVVYGLESIDGSGNRRFWLVSHFTGNGADTQLEFETITGSQTPPIHALTGGLTTVNPTQPVAVGTPVYALAWSDPGNAYMWLYPDPTVSPTNTPYSFANPLAGTLYCHQNRIVLFEQKGFPWSGTLGGTAVSLLINDPISYTDPPNSVTTFTATTNYQRSVFVQEHPQGYGTMGSFSASELFTVKNAGGGAIISGDLNFPSVTALPGVTPTYGVESRPSATPLGLVYLSNGNGVWSWAGNSSSQKLSQQLSDAGFVVAGYPIIDGPSFAAIQFGQWIAMTGNWMYDTITNAWWLLENPLTYQYIDFDISPSTGNLYAGVSQVSTTQTTAIDVYNTTTPAVVYFWQSFPIPCSVERNVVARRVSLRAQGIGAVVVTLTASPDFGSETETVTFDVSNANHPQTQIQSLGLQSDDIVISIQSHGTGSDPAPTVYSVGIAYEEQHLVSEL